MSLSCRVFDHDIRGSEGGGALSSFQQSRVGPRGSGRHYLGMTRTARSQRTYDHRLKQLVYPTGDIQIAIDQGVPRSTANRWLTSPPVEVVSVDGLDFTIDELRSELFALRKLNRELFALLRLFVVLVKVSGFSLARCRLPEGWKKRAILKAAKTSSRALPMTVVLRVLRLSARRYHTWQRSDVACKLDDMLSCPRTSPHQLTLGECAS